MSTKTRIPTLPLLIGLAVQTLVTMAAYSVPAAAPAIATELHIAGEWVGVFISMVYGVGIFSAVLSPGFIHRFGAVRVSQFILVCGIAMLATASGGGTVYALATGAVLLGIGYGATAPTSSYLLMKRTAPAVRNLVFSIRQIGVPLGGVLGGLLVPPLVLAFSWQTSLVVQLIPAVLLVLLLQKVRSSYDADRDPSHVLRSAGLIKPLMLLRQVPEIRALSLAVFFFAGTQLCFVAYTSVHLTSRVGFDLIGAGQILAAYQISGVVSRPIWGVIADRWMPAYLMLAAMGIVMAAMAVLAGMFSAAWSGTAVFAVAVVAGATASGYTGIAFAEFARIGGESHVAESAGLGASSQFFGVMVLPSMFSVIVSAADYSVAYNTIAALAAASGIALFMSTARS